MAKVLPSYWKPLNMQNEEIQKLFDLRFPLPQTVVWKYDYSQGINKKSTGKFWVWIWIAFSIIWLVIFLTTLKHETPQYSNLGMTTIGILASLVQIYFMKKHKKLKERIDKGEIRTGLFIYQDYLIYKSTKSCLVIKREQIKEFTHESSSYKTDTRSTRIVFVLGVKWLDEDGNEQHSTLWKEDLDKSANINSNTISPKYLNTWLQTGMQPLKIFDSY